MISLLICLKYISMLKRKVYHWKRTFGKVIELNPKVVLAYQNYPNKPQIGFGLNVPATITLEGIEPKANCQWLTI